MGNPETVSSSSEELGSEELGSILKTTDFFTSDDVKSNSFIVCTDKNEKDELRTFCFLNKNHLEKFSIFDARCQDEKPPVDIGILIFSKERTCLDVQKDISMNASNAIVKTAIQTDELYQHCETTFGKPKSEMPADVLKTIGNVS